MAVRSVHAACNAERDMPDALTAMLQDLLELEEPGCDCPRCDIGEYQRALTDHLNTVCPGYRPEHLRAAWEKPTPRAPSAPTASRR